MNKITRLFEKKNKDILSVYFTAGFPHLNDTEEIMNCLEKNKIDMIEIGIPFSDPLADGPVIQRSSEIALINGMSIKLLFDQLKKINIRHSTSAILLMGYLNPVLQYGIERFCKEAAAIGIDGMIIPDLPLQEYLNHYKLIFEKYDMKNIFLITPQTSENRIRLIDEHSNSFIYMVSSSSTTGSSFTSSKTERIESQQKYFERVQKMNLKNPLMTGFGISDHESFKKACIYSNGGIIGSAFIKTIEESKDLNKDIKYFAECILNGPAVNIN